MKFIPLSKGHFAIVDDADYEWLNQWRWYSRVAKKTVYAQRNVYFPGGKTTQQMHRLIMGVTDPKIEVDHQFHNGLDNQRKNLRVATKSQNLMNQQIRGNSTTGHKGVRVCKKTGMFIARFGVGGRKITVGHFDCKDEAARHYNRVASEYGGGFEFLNKVDPLFPVSEHIKRRRKKALAALERNEKYLSDLKSGFYNVKHKWVAFEKHMGKWRVRIKREQIGFYITQDEAIAARDAAIKKMNNGQYVRDNQD